MGNNNLRKEIEKLRNKQNLKIGSFSFVQLLVCYDSQQEYSQGLCLPKYYRYKKAIS